VTTLISVYNSDGCVGRCDAKCYSATTAECNCICRGVNHGAGKQRAAANTQQMAEQWIESWQTDHPEAERFFVRKHGRLVQHEQLTLL